MLSFSVYVYFISEETEDIPDNASQSSPATQVHIRRVGGLVTLSRSTNIHCLKKLHCICAKLDRLAECNAG